MKVILYLMIRHHFNRCL